MIAAEIIGRLRSATPHLHLSVAGYKVNYEANGFIIQ